MSPILPCSTMAIYFITLAGEAAETGDAEDSYGRAWTSALCEAPAIERKWSTCPYREGTLWPMADVVARGGIGRLR
eukprot:6454425-Prymnesium_polylepis.1